MGRSIRESQRFSRNRWIWWIWATLGPLGSTSIALILFMIRDLVAVAGSLLRRGDRRGDRGVRRPRLAAFLLTHRGRALVWLGLWEGACAISAALHPFRWAAWGQVVGDGLIIAVMLYEGSRLRWLDVPWNGIVGGTLAAAAWGILGTYHYGWTRAPGPLQGVNSFGTLLVLGGGLGFGYLLWRRTLADQPPPRSQGRGRLRGGARLLATVSALSPWAFLLVATRALLLTGSRGAWIGFAIYAVCMAMGYRRARWPVLGALAAGLAAVAVSPALHARLLSAFSLIANENRLTIWHTTLRIIRDHPWWGVGPANFSTVFDLYKPVPDLMASSAHNLLLTTWAESGLVALLFLVLFGTELLAALFHLVLAKPRDPLRWAALGVTLGVLFHQMVDHTLFSADLLGLFMGLLGICLGEADRLDAPAAASERVVRGATSQVEPRSG